MSVGAGLGNTQKWHNSSLSINTSYLNLAPYNAIFSDRNDWIKPYEMFAGETVFRKQTHSALFKLYGAFDATNFELIQEDINYNEGIHVKLNNKNFYLNSSYSGVLNDTWTFFGGASFTHGNNKMNYIESVINDTETSLHAKLKFKNRISNRFKLYFGTEYFATHFNETYRDISTSDFSYGFHNNTAAAYTEADVFISKNIAFKTGLRAEHSQLIKAFNLAPRVSLAYKTSTSSQLSLAYGNFYQNPTNNILKFEQDLKMQNTAHYILNYQHNFDGQFFRLEGYFKKYNHLVKYDSDLASFDSNFNNEGFGYAKGIA